MKQNKLQIFFVLVCLAFVNATNKPSSDWPVLVFGKGETANLPCPPQGHANAFFWRKGEWFNISENIASIVHGIPDTTEKYDVLGNGTLVIKDMSVDDEGKYFCRIASDKNECHGSITLYLEASPEAIDIAIEGCTPSSSCVKILEPSLEFQLTCTANMVAESMTLKWYNGSKEIIGNVHVSDTFGHKVKMTNFLKVMFEDESYLTCEAEGVNIAKSMAVIHLKKEEVLIPVEKEATTTLPVPTIILGILCLILTGILIYLAVRFRKFYKEQRKAICIEMNQKGAKSSNDKTEDQTAEEKHLFEENDTDLETKGELQKLQTELKETKGALKENKEELAKATMSLQKKEEEAEQLKATDKQKHKADITTEKLQTELEETKKALKEKEKELVIATQSMQKRENEAKQLESTDKQNVMADITNVKLQTELKQTKEALKKNKEKLVIATNGLQKRENEAKNLQNDKREANIKLVASENKKKELLQSLQSANTKLSASEDKNKDLLRQLEDTKKKLATAETDKKDQERKTKEEMTKRLKSEGATENIISKIIEMKDKILRNPPEKSPRVLIASEAELSKETINNDKALHKISNVSFVSGPVYQEAIFEKIKGKVETCFSGKDTYIFLFGDVESGLHNTLHGDKIYKGLIGRVAQLLFSLAIQLEKNGFEVNIHVSIASMLGEGKGFRLQSPSDKADEIKLRNGVKIPLSKYSVESEESFLKLASFMTPNKGNPKDHGLLKITVDVQMRSTMVSKGSIVLASISNLTALQKVFKEKTEDNFQEVLLLLTQMSRGDLVLITNVNPNVQQEPRRTFAAVKTTLDAFR